MIAEELINQMIPPLKVSDSAGKAAKWLGEFHVGQLPVLENRQYRGLITESDLLDYENSTQLLAAVPFGYANVHVQRDQHFYSVMEMAIQNKLQLVPVLDDQHEYMGVVTVGDTIAAFGQLTIGAGQGGILVLSMDERDYSLTQISRYVEENNAKILSSHVAQDENDPYKIRLTLKLNTANLTRIIATLERFGYVITAQFAGAGEISENEQERFDALLKYLSL
ncbi:CBS domain-containing protein [Hymenobacter jejuensis]|uniref:CBS domain-containing protein n=2 Tax=Hymenobacter TaxID=89966 RepID=A0A5B8A0T3_9BACT|nr:CBS domain-containing protein [Hymenobacter jejuensis]MBC6991405.1 CBS domain-containing protein [Hymenobacter sp. BT491]QDA59742.1 CBS domain-containing protein [Hymenobacter jejuensis]